MTDHMRDNPHYSTSLPDAAATSDGRAIADAILALAYENRTANLIAFVKLQGEHNLSGGGLELLRKRLGLGHD